MGANLEVGRSWARGFCARHPLFIAALVAAGCVAAASWNVAAGVALAGLAGFAGGWLSGWRTAAAWLACGVCAAVVFAQRTATRDAQERGLISSAGGEMRARVLADGQGGGDYWAAPAVLLNGRWAGAKIWWEGMGPAPVAGSRVMARGNFGPLPEMRNPGEFDKASWLRGQGVAAVFLGSRVRNEITTGKWAAMGADFRHGFRKSVTHGLDDASEPAAVIRAVVIGEKPPDSDELVAAFRNSGTLHAFTVSGLHVAMVGSIGWILLRFAGVSRRRAVLALLPLVFGYSWLTGNGPPAVRSAWMMAVFLGAFVFRRRPDLLNSLGAVLLVAMLWDGRLLFQAGVQLSYGVVAAIAIGAGAAGRLFAWIAKPELYLPAALMDRRQRASLWLRRGIAQSFSVSLTAGIGSTPLTAYHFGLLTPISVVAGVVIVPVIFLLLAVALFAVAFYPVAPPVTAVLNKANGGIAWCCVRLAEGFSAVPGGHYRLKGETRPFLLVYDLDFGAGAACFSDADESAVLFDCADRYSFKSRLAPSLGRLGVVPDSVVLSHPDGGHLGGGAQVWEKFPIRQVLLPVDLSRSPAFRSWAGDAPSAGLKTLRVADFKELPMPDGARLEVIHAPDPAAQNAMADNRVAIFRLHWRGWKLLLTSDAGTGTELDLLDAARDVSADVIIAGRHRDDETLCDPFLDAVNPRVILAAHSPFPLAERLDPRAVDYWKSRGIKVMHQGETGGVTIRVDDEGNLTLDGFVDGSRIVLEPR